MKNFALLVLISILAFSCSNTSEPTISPEKEAARLEACKKVMNDNLSAVSARDLEKLKSTLSPDGRMYFLMDGMKNIDSAEDYMKFHEGWFADTTTKWTMDFEILNSELGPKYAHMTVQGMYREPDRNGKPYYNKMMMSYVLEEDNGKWSVIRDHASSVEKSTD